ncbi:hypothetical protein J5N97_002194 [Dioscorea zingiberensis]|uniref:Cation/H+ exchanger domain-containing protein n=1 Tax=Dioscorea zingiberensis TaxID=325984 RepID=A0A9D5HP85_9LILI|nr:hypothetical protein J5N97_002194 [Dioscorea zingiberensis]
MATNITPPNQNNEDFIYNQTTVKKFLWICVKENITNSVTSHGLFHGNDPLHYSLPLLLLNVSLIFILSRSIHHVLKHLHQSRTISYIITGFLLGPSVIGQSWEFRHELFSPKSTFLLDTLTLLSLILFLFNMSVKTDLGMLKKPSRIVISTFFLGSILPLILCCFLYMALKSSLPADLQANKLLLLLACRFSLSSFPVVTDILDELGLLNTDLGRTATTTSLLTDIVSWFLNAFIAATLILSTVESIIKCVMAVVSFGIYLLIIVFMLRPMILRAIKKTPVGELLPEGYFVGIVLLALATSFLTELSGYHAAFGPMILGLALPGGMPLGVTLKEKLDTLMSGLFLPIYLVLAGYRTDFSKLTDLKEWGFVELIVIVTFLGKIVGSMAAPLYYKMPWRDALSLGLMMNLKGIIEVQFLNSWGDTEMANIQQFSILMVSLTLTTASLTPLIKYLYKPTMRYNTTKQRTVQHSKPNAELRLLVAVHNEDNVPPVVELLEASKCNKESPLNIYVLHVMELAGRAAAVLAPHKKRKKNPGMTASDRIVNAFRYLEKQNEGAVTVQAFVALAPSATKHNDVCALALEKKVRLVILPFHKQSDGALATANATLQSMNQNVLAYAPCSVAILVDNRNSGGATCNHTNDLLHRVAVFFLGGCDDREALAYGMRMARNPNINLTVVRFVSRGDLRELEDEEWKKDNEMVHQVSRMQANNILYREELVEDGEGTVAVMRRMSDKFDLLIVGRRKNEESALTSGLSMWSECPELGVIGDMLSATDFEVKVSILVVQQQERVEVGGEDGRKGQPGITSNTLSPPHQGVQSQEESLRM